MQRERMGRTNFYIIALGASVVTAMTLTALGDSRSPIPLDNSSLLGLLAFCFILVFDLFVMYDVWSMRQAEGRPAARMLAGLAAGGLALALVVGLVLRFVSGYPLEAFLGSFLILQSIQFFAFRWISRRDPDPTIPQWRPWPAFTDVLFFFFGVYLLIDVWQESPRAVAAGMTGALTLVLPTFFGPYLRWKSRKTGQTPDSIPPAVTK